MTHVNILNTAWRDMALNNMFTHIAAKYCHQGTTEPTTLFNWNRVLIRAWNQQVWWLDLQRTIHYETGRN